MGEARQIPPFAHAMGMKDGERVVKRWASSEKSPPFSHTTSMKAQSKPIFSDYYLNEKNARTCYHTIVIPS